MNQSTKALEQACERAGGQTQLAQMIGVSKQAVYKWLINGLPAERVLEVEKITGVSRHNLRPDIYPVDAA